MIKIAVIGGTGFYNFDLIKKVEEIDVKTPYGNVIITIGELNNNKIAFITRHGVLHSIPSHKINYRANIWALHSLGVEKVLATNAVGSINKNMLPGDLVFCDQFLDFTNVRPFTFFEGEDGKVVYTDMVEPYCSALRGLLVQKASNLGYRYHTAGTYICTEGPRFETAAEIKMFSIIGGDIIGMTGVPEVVLARELGICYANVSIVTNICEPKSKTKEVHEEVLQEMAKNTEKLTNVLFETLKDISACGACECNG